MSYNCVRYTYSIDFAAHTENQQLTVYQSLLQSNLSAHVDGVLTHNSNIINMTLISLFDFVLTSLSESNIMVILDNHVSHASWCCSLDDGNGWFNLGYFNVDEWINGLSFLSSHVYNQHHNIIAFSLRNEVRAPSSVSNPQQLWLQYMSQASKAVHSNNMDVLVFHGGLNYATDLTFIDEQNNIQVLVNDEEYAKTKIVCK